MFHIYKEGLSELKSGFNFYSLSDKFSFGVKINYGKKLPNGKRNSLLQIRYSKLSNKWFFTNTKMTLEDFNKWIEFEQYCKIGC